VNTRTVFRIVCVVVATTVWLSAPDATPQAQAARTMAVTIDDAPFVNRRGTASLHHADEATTRLLDTLRRHRAPAVVLVNERQLEQARARTARERPC
jgi:peptidoglycan/xylan/chitin deacetylase (PgdA/CDA1 family)